MPNEYPSFNMELLKQNDGKTAVVFEDEAEARLFWEYIRANHTEIRPLSKVAWDTDSEDGERTAYNCYDACHDGKHSYRMGFCREGWYAEHGWLLIPLSELFVHDELDDCDIPDINLSGLLS